MDSLRGFVSFIDSRSQGWNVVPCIRLSSDVKVVVCKFRVTLEKCLEKQSYNLWYQIMAQSDEIVCIMEVPVKSHISRC